MMLQVTQVTQVTQTRQDPGDKEMISKACTLSAESTCSNVRQLSPCWQVAGCVGLLTGCNQCS
jgi:hypothetical protein